MNSKIALLFFPFWILISSKYAFCSASTEDTARFLCDQVFNSTSYKYEDHFSKTFTDAIPIAYFRAIVDEATESTGKCTETLKITETTKSATYKFVAQQGNQTY